MIGIDVPEQMSWSTLAQLLGDEVANRLRADAEAVGRFENGGAPCWPADRPVITTYSNYPEE